MTNTQPQQELENKLVKFYFTECLSGEQVDLSLVDGSSNFDIIPTNSKGKIDIEVGDLRDIVKEVMYQSRKDTITKVLELPSMQLKDVQLPDGNHQPEACQNQLIRQLTTELEQIK